MMRPHALSRCRFTVRELDGPLLLLVWGLAVAMVLWVSGIDVKIQVWLFDNYNQGFNTFMRTLGGMGKGTMQVGLALTVGALWAFSGWLRGAMNWRLINCVLAVIPVFALAGGLNWVMKWCIGRGRPKEFLWNHTDPYLLNPFESSAQWWSFPSGHSCSTFAIAVWLGLAFPRLRYVFWLVAVVLSFSRFLALTPHYFGDVVAGATVGAVVAWSVWIMTHECFMDKEQVR